MALATTTLSAAVGVSDNTIVVASATSVSAGRLIRIDDEWMQVTKAYTSGTTVPVLRGRNGSVTTTHVASANVTHGDAADFDDSPSGAYGSSTVPPSRARRMTSLSAAGAITLPNAGEDMVAVLNGTNAVAATLANPTKDMDGCILIIVGNGKAAHTVTYTAGFGDGGSGYDVFTFAAGARNSVMAIAVNGIWVQLPSLIGGTATAITATIA